MRRVAYVQLLQMSGRIGRWYQILCKVRKTPARHQKHGAARAWIIGGFFAGLAVLGAITSPPPHGSMEATVAIESAGPTSIDVTAKELASVYGTNEAAAQQKCGWKAIRVSGTIAAIADNFDFDPVINLEGKNLFLHVMLSLADDSKAKATELSMGQKITATCKEMREVIRVPELKRRAL